MKKLYLLAALALIAVQIQAQDTTNVKVLKKNIVTVNEEPTKTEVSILNDKINIQDNYFSDTTTIRVGRRNIEIIEGKTRTYVNMEKDDDDGSCTWGKHKKKFNGHWSGFDIGVNGLANTDYSLYKQPGNELPIGVPSEFMELRQAASLEVNLNFVEYNISLKEDRVGIVSGLGLQWNNYKFDNSITINKMDDGLIHPLNIEENNFKKSKLTASYLTLPIMLEFQIPVNDHSNSLFISGGMVGALNIGSHSKVKNDHSKDKDHGSFNINPFKYSAIARIGLRDFSLYATYSFSTLFREDRGPEMFPFTIGISLINF
ncbi:outer membrane beta-barrel protein [Mangrovibacterium lignilyticum]|uniref:outer membrane beta-barrel protein n=1 Tax=Mangrovibacterium lignilyticum TaxID=2668052 RepID=UPI0013D53FEB|nr:outer membrane beta-barrel protein [Mangrovibacterium lignilyticum]